MLIFAADAADVIIVDGILLLLIVDHSAYTDVVCVVAAVDVDVDSDGANTKKQTFKLARFSLHCHGNCQCCILVCVHI